MTEFKKVRESKMVYFGSLSIGEAFCIASKAASDGVFIKSYEGEAIDLAREKLRKGMNPYVGVKPVKLVEVTYEDKNVSREE